VVESVKIFPSSSLIIMQKLIAACHVSYCVGVLGGVENMEMLEPYSLEIEIDA